MTLFSGEGWRKKKTEKNSGKYEQLCTSSEGLNVDGVFIYLFMTEVA